MDVLHQSRPINNRQIFSIVEILAPCDDNSPSHEQFTLGEVAERLNALVLKTSKGL